ncbi:hypothetical protein Pla175_31400 [Pirellulimonas nuda]|uniref:Sulfatase n=1 Tax=Pirellulimonas nuda TaxID=2528009 RepID=A0A518DE37_9BACT|nr:DUF1501 domain-containing protein [Pirellulimonas nuda]QDU89745.1 hypothetical protein Pla175_31400 [Pirellulimonas nuda]
MNPHGPDNALLGRREMLTRCGMGLGAMTLGSMLAEPAAAAASPADWLAPRPPQFAARAKHVIHLFMNGGPSHLDTFDPKPALVKYAGKPLEGGAPSTERPTGAPLPSPFKFRRHGESGIEVSELFPNVAKRIDDIAVIRSMYADVPNHEPSLLLMNCGDARQVRPSFGSWVTYGLGAQNQNLPAFVVLCPGGFPIQETQNWQSGFLPGVYQGSYVDPSNASIEQMIEHIRNDAAPAPSQIAQLALIRRLDAHRRAAAGGDPNLESRIQSLELGFRMQSEATDAFDLSGEPQHIRDLYGPGVQGRQMLLARRLVERGVRTVQVWHGAGQPWDSHDDLEIQHRRLAGECDQAIGALLHDLKQRGLLDETLVLWGGEFGRTPTVELPKEGSNAGKINGRDHNHYGFTVWMAGGGVRGGQVYGATDELGFKAVEDRVHVHDLHATMLRLLGFDHTQLTYRHAGRDFRLTDVHGRVIDRLIA